MQESNLPLVIQNSEKDRSTGQKELFRRQFCTRLLMTGHIKKVDFKKKTQPYSVGKDPSLQHEQQIEPQKDSVCYQERYYTPKPNL